MPQSVPFPLDGLEALAKNISRVERDDNSQNVFTFTVTWRQSAMHLSVLCLQRLHERELREATVKTRLHSADGRFTGCGKAFVYNKMVITKVSSQKYIKINQGRGAFSGYP
jgi:hypothetical protein